MGYLPLKIKAKKQENGLWGTPFNCVYIDKVVFVSDENWKLRSAIMMALAEVYPNHKYRIENSSETGFTVTLYLGYIDPANPNKKWYRINYKNYELKGDTLFYINEFK